MLADPRARPTLDEFFADWTKVDELPDMDAKNTDPVFKAFAATDLPDTNLRQALMDDVVGLLDYYTWTVPSPVGSIFSTIARSPATAGWRRYTAPRPGTAPAPPRRCRLASSGPGF